ncbi:MAG: hypothetical protein PHN56_04250, partial [Candidatus Nanoarchaeia archaeon]|nr:hypothetical protein [Candidatus Nanoarchaeia archaeon]
MNFKKMVEDSKEGPISIGVNSFTIKNKGSIMKIGTFYTDFYNDLIEKWGLKCVEPEFKKVDTGVDVTSMYWKWLAYKNIDNFARIQFKFGAKAFRIAGDTVMGIFSIEYNLELDYGHPNVNYTDRWRSNSFLKMM